MLASRGWNFEQILRQYYQDPDGRLRLDFMDRYKIAAANRLRALRSAARSPIQPTSDEE